MRLIQPESTRTNTLFPHTELFRAARQGARRGRGGCCIVGREGRGGARIGGGSGLRLSGRRRGQGIADQMVQGASGGSVVRRGVRSGRREIGRAHVWTPVTNAHLVCRLLLEKKN